jgi:hypothetical protein
MPAGLNIDGPQLELLRLTHGFHNEDFDHFVTADRWSVVATDGGGGVGQDAAGGVLLLDASDCTVADNDEVYLKTKHEIFLFADNKPIRWGARVQYAEANTDDANVWIGLMDAIAANSLVDNGAGPKTSGSHFGFFKVDGGTNWKIHSSLGTTQNSVELTAALSKDKAAHAAGSASYFWFHGIFLPYAAGSDKGQLHWLIDDTPVYVQDAFDYTSATEMNFGFGIKNGGANEETMSIDACYCVQKR